MKEANKKPINQEKSFRGKNTVTNTANFNVPLNQYFRLKPEQLKALKILDLNTVHDLLRYFPKKYIQSSDAIHISDIANINFDTNKEYVLYGKVSKLKTGKTFKGNIPIASAQLHDDTSHIKVMWIRQPYIAKIISEDSLVRVIGKVSIKKDSPILINPRIEKVDSVPEHIGGSLFEGSGINTCTPIYAETKGITSLWFYHAFKKIFADPLFSKIYKEENFNNDPNSKISVELKIEKDPIPFEIRKKYNLPSIYTALIWIHTPEKEKDAEAARKRFAFEEIFFIQLSSQIEKQKAMKELGFTIKDNSSAENFIQRLSFDLTQSQKSAIDQILSDMKRPYPMSRLLEGDVGSGKTAVAAASAYAVVKERPKNQSFGTLQVAYMAPTEILAKQHFESFIGLFRHLPISIALITGKECRKFPSKVNPDGWTHISKSQLSKWVANGEISIVIGTHALIQKNVNFKHLGLVIIDEQHRFGTNQRQKLARKHDITPHLLSMTATPIPRTLALTLYGDLDLSILDQMPSGRKEIKTEIVKPVEIKKVYKHIREEIIAGRQAYIICPRIEEDEEITIPGLNNVTPTGTKSNSNKNSSFGNNSFSNFGINKPMKSVVGEAKRLKKEIFPEFNIGILHGKMKPEEKEKVMNDFLEKKIDILVATSVVEVGVNVPNASIILIEHAERYGLSQLHQLRGRVIRGNHQPYCYLSTDTTTSTSIDRLKAIKTAKNGFELSELDLKLRGVGELYAGKQWGVSDIAMDAIQNLKMVEAARNEASKIAESDPDLKNYPLFKSELETREKVHFE